jgi:hypothetical protein
MTPAIPAADPRLAAFLDPRAPEVFHAVVHQTQLWRADPFDVPAIHAEARQAFACAFERAAAPEPPDHGKVLLLLGEAGSGKTHLIRAFRQLAHGTGQGCLGYLQMTAQADNYAAYILSNLIDSLEQPYDEPRVQATALARLSRGVLDALPLVDAGERQHFRDGHVEPADLPLRVNAYADMAVMDGRFAGCDLDVVRALVYLQRDDPRVRARVLRWLRCEDLAGADRDVLGGLVPRTKESDPLRMIVQLGRLLRAVLGAALVLCVDQLEDMFNQDAAPARLRKVVDALVAVADQLPSALVVIACLEDYYAASKQHLAKPKLDRLEHDPAPVRLAGRRTAPEVVQLLERRLECLYGRAGAPLDGRAPTYPFTAEHLERLAGLSTREVLRFCRDHQQHCIAAGRWLEPAAETVVGAERQPPTPAPDSAPAGALEQAWNDFHAGFKGAVPCDETDLASLLAWAIAASSAELPDGRFFGAEADGRMVSVELHGRDNAVDRSLVAVCNRAAQGGGLQRQIEEAVERADEFPVVFVRSSDFPTSSQTQVVRRLDELTGPGARNRRAVVQDSEWRAMLALRHFHQYRGREPGFAAWQRQAQPLTKLASLRRVLALDRLTAPRRAAPRTPPPAPPAPGAAPGRVILGLGALTRHVAFLTGPGDGGTAMALRVVEQLLAAGIPAVVVDRTGALCRHADPAAWEGPDRRRLRAEIDVALYTPGSAAGRPLGLRLAPANLGRLPPAQREQVASCAAVALGALMSYRPRGAEQGKLALLARAIDVVAASGAGVTVPGLRRLLAERDGALRAAGPAEERARAGLDDDLTSLWLRHKALLDEGVELPDAGALLDRGPGRTRLTIITTRFLSDPAVADFWLARLLGAFVDWAAASPPSPLRGVLLLDGAEHYLAAARQPLTRAPLEDLLRRASPVGLSLLLATRSLTDFDCARRHAVGTWVVGQVREPRALAHLRPLFAGSKLDVWAQLASLPAGDFFLLQGDAAVRVVSAPPLLPPGPLPDERILELARAGRPGGT